MDRTIVWAGVAIAAALGACSFKEVDAGSPSGGSGGSGSTSTSTTTSSGGLTTSTGTTSASSSGSTSTSGSTGSGGMPPPQSIGCGASTCQAPDQMCCLPDETCVPAGSDCGSPGAVLLFCDDASDCASGEACCAPHPKDPAPTFACGPAPCAFAETCAPGGECASDGLSCVDDASSPTGAACVPTSVSVACGAADCSGAQPVCCWDPGAATGGCTAAGDPCAVLALGCTSAGDCGAGYACCAGGAGSTCKGVCEPSEARLCLTAADCAAGGTCVIDPGYPDGVGTCQ